MSINTPTGWDVELKSIMGWLSDKKRDELLEMLKQDKRERERRKEREILEDLRDNHVKIEESKEVLGNKWKNVHIDLPAVWNFKWFNFDFFLSDDVFSDKDFKKEKNYEEMSYTMEELSELLESLRGYMIACWVPVKYVDHHKEALNSLRGFEWSAPTFTAAWYLQVITNWLHNWNWWQAWLKDRDGNLMHRNSHVALNNPGFNGIWRYNRRHSRNSKNHYMFKLSS